MSKWNKGGTRSIEEVSEFKFSSELNMMRYVASGFKQPPEALSQVIDNACDANATKVRIAVYETSRRVVIMYNGDPITRKDMERIRTGVGKSSKVHDPNKLGRFGTGFITFLAYANKQTIVSISQEGEFVWINEPDEKTETLGSNYRPLQASERTLETKYPLISLFHERYASGGNYILIENIHDGKIDALLGKRFLKFMGGLWADRLHSTAYTLNSIEYAVVKQNKKKIKWTEIKNKDLDGDPFHEREIGEWVNDDNETITLPVEFDLVISSKIDDPVWIQNRSQPIMTLAPSEHSTGLKHLPKDNPLRSRYVAGALRIKADSIISFDRSSIDEYSDLGKAFLDACEKIRPKLQEAINIVEGQEVDKLIKADNERYTSIINDLCHFIGFTKMPAAPTNTFTPPTKEKKKYRDFAQAINALKRDPQIRAEVKRYSFTVEVEPFLKEQLHMRFKMSNDDVIRINRSHKDFEAVSALPPKSGEKNEYILRCMLACLARKTKEPTTSVEEEAVRLRTEYALMRTNSEVKNAKKTSKTR